MLYRYIVCNIMAKAQAVSKVWPSFADVYQPVIWAFDNLPCRCGQIIHKPRKLTFAIWQINNVAQVKCIHYVGVFVSCNSRVDT